MMERISSKNLRVMFGNHEKAADMLRYGIEHCERSLASDKPEERLDVLRAKGHAVWFAGTSSSIEWLYLLWDSTENDSLRFELVEILRRAMQSLPAWDDRERNTKSDALRLTAPIFLGFVRTRRATELLSTISLKSFGNSGWLKDDDLCARVLLAVYACNYTVEASEFFERMVGDAGALRRLNLRQLHVFCAEYIASARRRFEGAARGQRDTFLEQQLNLLVAEAYPRTDDSRTDGGAAFGKAIQAVINEATAGIELPTAIREQVGEILNALHPDTIDVVDMATAIVRRLQEGSRQAKGRALPSDKESAAPGAH